MGRIFEVRVKRNVATGHFEHKHVELAAEVDEGEDWREVLAETERKVNVHLGIDYSESDVKAATNQIEKATHAAPAMLTTHIHGSTVETKAIATTASTGSAILAYQSQTPAASKPAETDSGVNPHDRYIA